MDAVISMTLGIAGDAIRGTVNSLGFTNIRKPEQDGEV
jgi:hypothetical protein